MPKIAQKINEFKRVSAREVSQMGMAVLAMTIFSSSRKCLKSCQTINFEEKNFRIFFFFFTILLHKTNAIRGDAEF